MGKKIISYLIVFLIGGLIFGSIGTVLALTYKASDIVYSPNDTSWNVSTVGEAINSLALSKTATNYSLEEQVVGTWIDGKPLYQRTLVANTTTNSTISYNDISLNIDQIIDIKFKCGGHWQSDKWYVYNNYYYQDNNNSFRINDNYQNKSIGLIAGSLYANEGITITFQYTKTTD